MLSKILKFAFLHLFVTLLYGSLSSKGIKGIKQKSFQFEIQNHFSLKFLSARINLTQQFMEQCPMHIIMCNLLHRINLILKITFLFKTCDSCYKKMLLESLTIPLIYNFIDKKELIFSELLI